jgi:hypothetical protein
MLTVLARLTVSKTKNKLLLSYFHGSLALPPLQYSRTDQIKWIFGQIVEA